MTSVSISSGETPETFEQHQGHKLKADGYLIKDGNAATVVGKVADMLGLALGVSADETAAVVERLAADGIVKEHVHTRAAAGLFDVSHMGRFVIDGEEALPFLQRVLSNNAAALDVEESQYTMIPDENGGAVDDAYLYRFMEDEFLLVVNAANLELSTLRTPMISP